MSRKVSLAVSLLALFALPCLAAAKFNQKLDVGSAGPDFSKLTGTDGKTHSMADYKEAKLLVVVFTTNTCPVAMAYQDRLKEIQKDFSARGVQVVAINCNTNGGNDLEAMKQRATEQSFNFPYLYDESQQSGKSYGATVTPHVFVLDAERKVVYMGAVDDNMRADRVKNHYLKDALTSLLDNKAPAEAETQQFGCGIHYQ